jgi:hypothetical protein
MIKDYNKFVKLERYINRFKFRGIPLGSTLADLFIHSRIYGGHDLSKIAKLYISEFFSVFTCIFNSNARQLFNTPLISTRISGKAYFEKMIIPIIEHFGDKATVVYNPEIEFHGSSAKLLSVRETFATPTKDILKVISLFFVLARKLFINKNKLDITYSDCFFFSIKAFHQARIIAFYHNQFTKSKCIPMAIVTEYDRNGIASPLILTGKKFNIKTVTLIHGAIGKSSFTPVLADFVYCFGNIQKEQFLNYHVPEAKIKITGTSIIDRKVKPKPHTDFSSLFRIGLGISPMGDDFIKYMINESLEALNELVNCSLIIKLHPSLKKKDFIQYEYYNKNVRVLDSSEISNYEFFESIDLLLIHSSGLGFEAMLNYVPVAVFYIPDFELGVGELYIDNGNCPLIKDKEGFVDLITNFKSGKKDISLLVAQGNVFVREYYFAYGSEASHNIINELESLLKRGF